MRNTEAAELLRRAALKVPDHDRYTRAALLDYADAYERGEPTVDGHRWLRWAREYLGEHRGG